MLAPLLAGLLTLGAGEVSVKPLNGPAVTGTLVEMSSDRVAVETDDGRRTFETGELLAVDALDERSPAAPGGLLLDLVDGSRLAFTAFEVTSGKAQVCPFGVGEGRSLHQRDPLGPLQAAVGRPSPAVGGHRVGRNQR